LEIVQNRGEKYGRRVPWLEHFRDQMFYPHASRRDLTICLTSNGK